MITQIDTATVDAAILTVSGSLGASIVAKASVTAALGLIGAWLARRSRAAVRHALLAATFGVLLMLPVVAILAPPIYVALASPTRELAAPKGSSEMISPVLIERASAGVRPMPRPRRFSPSMLLLSVWIAGIGFFLLPVFLGLRQIRRWRHSAQPWPLGQSEVDWRARGSDITRRIDVLLHDRLPGPMTCGVMRPTVMLPRDAQDWDRDNLNRAIVHELEHIRRHDWLSLFLARTVCALYWFHPLVWMAWHRLALAAERSCDDAVLGSSEATAYADQLVGLAKRLSLRAKTPLVAMANHADLSARVQAVLDSRQRRGRAGRTSIAVACAAATVLVLTISPLSMVAAPQTPVLAPGILHIAPPEIAMAQVAAASLKHVPIGPRIFQVAAQTTATPRFFSTTMLVIVDVTVANKDGYSIEGLQPGDFTISEDGVPKSVILFEFQRLPAPPVATGARDPISSYYILGYYASDRNGDGSFRKIRVTGGNDVMSRLTYRTGYYSEKLWRRAGEPAPERVARTDQDSANPGDPVAIYKPEANYSEEARKAKWQGTTTLSVDIDVTGAVTNAQVLRSLGLGLDEKALDAVKQWKFSPGTKDGNPVPVQAQVEFSFRLL